MRRLAGKLGVTQPVLYSAFASRQALIDAVALSGFSDVAAALEAVDASPGTLIEILAGLAILANAVSYGTDVFGAIVLRPAIAGWTESYSHDTQGKTRAS